MRCARQLGITTLMLYTTVMTALRAIRPPSDFAEAFWLLDYRFGFVKRALVGEVVTLVTTYLAVPATEGLIASLSYAAFGVFCGALILISWRILERSDWSADSCLVLLAFLSSPFVVMSAHLVGYHDNIVMILGILSIAFLLKGKPWLGALLQILALLTNEISMLVVFPCFCLAWLLLRTRGRRPDATVMSPAPLLMLMGAFMLLILGQEAFLRPDFARLFEARLSQYSFIQEARNTWVPFWVTVSFRDYLSTQTGAFAARLASIDMLGLVLPSAMAMLLFIASAYRLGGHHLEALALLAASFAPQLMHLMAWDTARIWTYTILCAFLALWIYTETSTADKPRRALAVWSVGAILLNAFMLTPLMDLETDHFSLAIRLVVYSPVFIGALILAQRGDDAPLKTWPDLRRIGMGKRWVSSRSPAPLPPEPRGPAARERQEGPAPLVPPGHKPAA
jgi:hypothetical protein